MDPCNYEFYNAFVEKYKDVEVNSEVYEQMIDELDENYRKEGNAVLAELNAAVQAANDVARKVRNVELIRNTARKFANKRFIECTAINMPEDTDIFAPDGYVVEVKQLCSMAYSGWMDKHKNRG